VKLALSALVLGLAVAAVASPVKTTVKITGPLVAGKTFRGQVFIVFPAGYHAYANPPSDEYQIPVKVTLTGANLKNVKFVYPKGTDFLMNGEEKPSKVYQGTVAVPFSGSLTKAGKVSLAFKVEYQMCDEHACLPPDAAKSTFTLVVKK